MTLRFHTLESPLFVEGLTGGAVRTTTHEDAAEEPPVRSPPPEPESDPGPLLPLRHLTREVSRTLQVSRGAIWRLGPGEVRCLTRHHRDADRFEEGRSYPAPLGEALRFLLERTSALAMDDVRGARGASGPIREWLAEEGIRALLALPVRVGGRLEGFVTLEESAGPRRWAEVERNLAAALAHQAGSVLERMAPFDSEAELRARENGVPPAMRPDATEVEGPLQSSLRRLRPLEGAAVLGGRSAESLIRKAEAQEGYLSLLEAALHDRPDDRELLEELRDVTARLRRDLLRLDAQLQRGVVESEVDDLNRLIPGWVDRLVRVAGPGIRLRLAPSSGVLRVPLDATLFEEALVELVRNARRASADEGTIRLAWRRVREGRGGEGESEFARIEVSDQGVGISPERLPWVFEPLFTTQTQEEGRGMGLPFVQAVVEGHGGWIDLRSGVGLGTQVVLHLPLEGQPGLRGTEEVATSGGDGKGFVLLVHDDPIFSRLFERTLARDGFRVEVVDDVEEAHRIWRKSAPQVRFVAVGRELEGGIAGAEVVAPWLSRRPGLAVVLLDHRNTRDTAPTLDHGIPVLARPFEPADLLALVRSARSGESTGDAGTSEDGGIVAH